MTELQFQVAGVTFENRQDILWELKKSDSWAMLPMREVKLVREPSNKFDKNAIKVMLGKKSIGYVPATLAEDLSPKLRKKQIVVDDCVLIALRGPSSRPDILGAKIKLTYTEKKKR